MADTPEKSIIYLEHDAEITEAIEKLKAADGDEVRIVVPNRSPLLQSVVNLKLMKKAVESSKKDLVLVTADKHAAALAGKIGLPVAKNVKAEAKVPEPEPEPKAAKATAAALAGTAVLGAAAKAEAGDAAAEKVAEQYDEYDDVNDVPVQRYDAGSSRETANKKKEKKTGKSSGRGKVPNYDRFKLWIWIGAGLVGFLLFAWLLQAFVQTATVNVQATADRRDVSTSFVLSSSPAGSDVPAKTLETTKDLTQSVQASGQKDVGSKATGNLSISNCSESDDFTIPAGSVVTTGGKRFTTNASAAVSGAKFSGGGNCSKPGTGTVAVTAAENGDSFNFSSATFSFANYVKVTATGTTSGGVTKNITVVSQADVDNTVKTLVESSKSAALSELKDKAPENSKVFDDTLTATVISQASNPPVGTEASNATITVKAKYSVLSANKDDITKVVEKALGTNLANGSKVLDAGLDQATYTQTKAGQGTYTYSIKTVAYIGQPIDEEKLKQDVAGKPKKDVSDIARQYPNVSGATVDGWPLFPNMPSTTSNIKVKIQVSK